MVDTIINYAYIIFVPIIAIAGTVWYMQSHTIISNGPEGELKGCFGVFVSFIIAGVVIVTIGIYALMWFADFFIGHWKWFAGGVAVLVALAVWGSKESSGSTEEKKAE